MSTQRGNVERTRSNKYKNTYKFVHNKNSRKTKQILESPIEGVCEKCYKILAWKKEYRKYKPLTVPKRWYISQTPFLQWVLRSPDPSSDRQTSLQINNYLLFWLFWVLGDRKGNSNFPLIAWKSLLVSSYPLFLSPLGLPYIIYAYFSCECLLSASLPPSLPLRAKRKLPFQSKKEIFSSPSLSPAASFVWWFGLMALCLPPPLGFTFILPPPLCLCDISLFLFTL